MKSTIEHKKRNSCILFVIATLPTLLMGCTHSNYQEYPINWGNLVAAQGQHCPNISGTYEYRNEKERCSIGGMLSNITSDIAVTHVEISQGDSDYLEITLWNDKALVRKDRLRRDEGYSCVDTAINLAPEQEVFRLVIGWNYVKNQLMKTQQGFLVIKSVQGNYGLLGYLIPVAEQYTFWCRFGPVTLARPGGG